MEKFLRNISLRTWAIVLFVLGILLFSIPFILTRYTFCNIDFTATGQIGDTISGTTAPFIGFIGIILTFVAFWVQYRANIDQREDLHIERVESKFYEMVRLHRDNVTEISIGANSPAGSVEGRKAFISMFEEFKYGYHLLEMQYKSSRELRLIELELTPGDLTNIAYVFFFFGVGTLSTPLATQMLQNYPQPLIVNYDEILKRAKDLWRSGDKRAVEINGITAPYLPNLTYVPFDGHLSRLGHYYRHLFQTVKYIDQQPDEVIENKYDYIKNLRAQLSTHEQLLLYYNALSRMGRPWITEDFMRRYCIVKNMPLPLANFGPDPIATLGERNEQGIWMFEWNEVVL